jgi:hypothetical protein
VIHSIPPYLKNEQWLPWPRKPSLLVSSFGRVWSTKRGKLRTINIGTDGYPYVAIRLDGRQSTFRLHRMVIDSFLRLTKPLEAGRMQVRHINGVKTDCQFENLALGTPYENTRDTMRLGKHGGGGKRFSDDDVIEMRRLHSLGISNAKIAAIFTTSVGTVQKINSFKTRTSVQSDPI